MPHNNRIESGILAAEAKITQAVCLAWGMQEHLPPVHRAHLEGWHFASAAPKALSARLGLAPEVIGAAICARLECPAVCRNGFISLRDESWLAAARAAFLAAPWAEHTYAAPFEHRHFYLFALAPLLPRRACAGAPGDEALFLHALSIHEALKRPKKRLFTYADTLYALLSPRVFAPGQLCETDARAAAFAIARLGAAADPQKHI